MRCTPWADRETASPPKLRSRVTVSRSGWALCVWLMCSVSEMDPARNAALLTVGNASPADEGTYYCAIWFSGQFVFGEGTRLLSQDKMQHPALRPPELSLFIPAYGPPFHVLCVALGHEPEPLRVSWVLEGKYQEEEDSTGRTGDPTVSWLQLPREVAGMSVTCRGLHQSGVSSCAATALGPSGAGADPYHHHLLLPGTAGRSSHLWPHPGCSPEESLLLGPPYGATPPRGSRSGPQFQRAGGQEAHSCCSPRAQVAEPQRLPCPLRGCPCRGPPLLAPAGFLLVCCLSLPVRPLSLPGCPNFSINTANLRRHRCAMCCSGQERWDPGTKVNRSQGRTVHGLV